MINKTVVQRRTQNISEGIIDMKNIFISYSYDSPTHEEWVENFAHDLSENGINVILDKWSLHLGQDINLFMEESIREADKVIIVCTDNYLNKSKKLEGGVGFEKNIMSANLIYNLKTTKFIPVVRRVEEERKIPDFLGNRLYVDLSENAPYETNINWLINEIKGEHTARKRKKSIQPFKLFPAYKIKDKNGELPQVMDGLDDNSQGLMNIDIDDLLSLSEGNDVYTAQAMAQNCDNLAAVTSDCLILNFKLASIDLKHAKGVLIKIIGNRSMTMDDFNSINKTIHQNISDDCNVKIGVELDESASNIGVHCWVAI